jgi:hypothetical protein
MNKVASILFAALWTCSTPSLAIDVTIQALRAEQITNSLGEIHGPNEWGIFFMLEVKTDNSTTSGPAEEETEDEDNTSKENVFYGMSSIHLSLFLQQLSYRQNAIFKEHHPEVEAPPPRS